VGNALRVKGEERGEYFHGLCADCGEHLQLKMTQRSLDLAIDAECRKCIASDSYKLLPPFWSGAGPGAKV
jgi:hypothetical protein